MILRSLYSKFLLFTTLTMIGSATIAFLIVNTYYHQFLKSENDAKNMRILQQITTYIEDNPELNVQQFLTTQAATGYKMLLVKEDESDIVLETFGESFRSFNLDVDKMIAVLDGTDYHGMRNLPKETFVTGFFADELANSVGTSFTLNNETYALFLRPNIKMLFSEVHYLLGGMFIGMGVISLISMLFVARLLIKPLRQLTMATEKIRAGHYDVPLEYKSNDEIGQLARSFTNMTIDLAKADAMQKQFITDVSHDLQTPLQQMKGYATIIREGGISDEEKANYLRIIERETERLSNLSRQLLVLTSLDAKQHNEAATTFSLNKQIKDIVMRFRWQLEKKNITLTVKIDEVMVEGVESLLEQLWENVLSNAIKYTMPGGTIALMLDDTDRDVVFTIVDDGIGIPEEKLPKVFDRFYRVDDARGTNIEGTGLGLAIVKDIVELHGGTIDIESDVKQGTKVTITLKK